MVAHVVKREGAVYYFEGHCGDSIRSNILEVLVYLKAKEEEGQQVKGVLAANGASLNLVHTDDVELALLVWKKIIDDNSKAYLESPEYKAEELKRHERALVSQKNMDNLVVEIKKILTDWAAVHGGSDIQPNGDTALRLMLLFKEYIEEADSIHIEHYGTEILPLMEAAGYKENEFTMANDGRKPVQQYETRAWFVGQMINMMKSHGCSHPGLASVVEKYKLHLNP